MDNTLNLDPREQSASKLNLFSVDKHVYNEISL